MTEIPLFPLGVVLLPHGRMALRIFEQRYLDLIRDTLKADQGFGVVWIRHGSEVVSGVGGDMPQMAQVGCYARIVDWSAEANGLLGIVVEGSQRFRLLSSFQQPNNLHMAQIEWLDEEPDSTLPVHADGLRDLLKQLLAHPQIAKLGYSNELTSVSELSCVLTQLLPIDESIKFALLSAIDPSTRLEQLVAIVEQLS